MIDHTEISLQQKWKDSFWCKEVMDSRSYRFLQQTIPIARRLYGENFDINLGFNNRVVVKSKHNAYGYKWEEIERTDVLVNIDFVFHFPDITIENSNGVSHQIKDLFVRLGFNIDPDKIISLIDPNGTRSTLSEAEYKRGYIHSHLNTKDLTSNYSRAEFTDFCLGDGAMSKIFCQLQTYFSSLELNEENNYTIDSNLIKLYFLQLKDYVTWESIEGVPYVSIETMVCNPNFSSYRDTRIGTSYLEGLTDSFKHFYDRNNLPDLNWRIQDNSYKLIEDIYLHNSLVPLTDPDFIFYKNYRGNFYRQSIMNPDVDNIEESDLFIYKGEMLKFKVYYIEQAEVVIEDKQKYVHEKIINYVQQQLESSVNKKALISSYLPSKNSLILT